MANLAHWDFAENFSGYDAAALILGLEPRLSDIEQWRVRVVTDRMEIHYKYALEKIFSDTIGDRIEHSEMRAINSQILLTSVKADELHHRCWLYEEETPLSDWISGRQCNFDNQEFSRNTIARWLDAIGMSSVYQFDRRQTDPNTGAARRWPWGDHDTELLGHLEAAAREFWSKYDPKNIKGTAPKNETVIAWLMARSVAGQKRKVSEQMARAIATMLRPDDLPTGPRK